MPQPKANKNMTKLFSSLIAIIFLSHTTLTSAADLNVGDDAPVFKSIDDAGNVWDSKDHIGKNIVVLYFYPADLTGGCTKQACGFRDDMKKLKEQGVEVIGVSGDTPDTHVIFKKEHELNFTLLADETGSVAKAFGVPVGKGGTIKKTIDGEKLELTRGVTAKRWTFLIDQSGKIAMKNTKVKAAEDSKAIIKAIEELK